MTADPTTEDLVDSEAAATPGVGSAEAAGLTIPPMEPEPRRGLSPVVWVGGLIGVIVLLLVLYGLAA